MTPQVITVHDIYKSIEDMGVQPYANTLCQDMGGQYYYVEADLLEKPDYKPGYLIGGEPVIDCDCVDAVCGDACKCEDRRELYWQYRVWDIPLRLAWFVIDALKLKSQVSNIGHHEYDEVRQAVYLTPGKEIFGTKIEKLTEIPATLMPVVVEKL